MIVHRRVEVGPARHPICHCGARGQHNATHDAYYCPDSGVWLEDRVCDREECAFCARPEKAPQ